jgi:hypothetical protein
MVSISFDVGLRVSSRSPPLLRTTRPDATLGQVRLYRQQLSHRPRQPIGLRHHQHVTFTQEGQTLGKSRGSGQRGHDSRLHRGCFSEGSPVEVRPGGVVMVDFASFPEEVPGACGSAFSPVLLVVVATAAGPAGPVEDVSPGRAGVVLLTLSPADGWATAPATGNARTPTVNSIEREIEIIAVSFQRE